MKKLMMTIGWVLIGIMAMAQPPHLAVTNNSDQEMLANLIDGIDDPTQTLVCMPWASTPRLQSITVGNQQAKDLLRFENLWVALNETYFEHQIKNTTLEIVLDKRGKISGLIHNGRKEKLSKKHPLKTQRFKSLADTAGQVIKVNIKIG